ncbi:hypothetical protein PRIC2_008080 [Phytophthora ramorum]
MEPHSLSSSSSSTIPSVLENSDYDEDQSGNYAEEEFESEGDHESPVAALVSLNSSSSEKYGSDEFEDDHEVSGAVEDVDVGSSEGANDYELESFERDDEASSGQEPAAMGEPAAECAHRDLVPYEIGEQQKQLTEAEELKPATERALQPQLGSWCSKKIQDLRAATSKVESDQPQIKRAPNNIPADVVENLINRATASRRSRSNQNISRPCPTIKVPAALMQRAQTQLWVAKSSRENTSPVRRPNKPTLETHSASTCSAAPTFCCVKREDLLGKLATIHLSENANRWAVSESGGLSLATLDFVQSMVRKQREIYSSSSSSDEPGGKMLHRVTMTARLQLEDSIALRHQAAELLGRANER